MTVSGSRIAARLTGEGVRSSAIFIALLAMSAGAAVQSPAAAQIGSGAASAREGRQAPVAWPSITKPQAGAPNVLLIMTDDVGFGSTSTFGGMIPTPNLDALAKNGARYNQFNTTALCSPTRAALLTGRNPHRVAMGNVTNLATGYEGYTSVIPKSAGMIAETLRSHGYATAAFGKWHLAPEWELGAFGPFDRWPTGQGFNYFYGFHGGDTDQFAPALIENTVPISPPSNDPSYILDRDLADQSIRWIEGQRAVAPDHPFFVYIAPGTAHSPISAPTEWMAKFRGKFDRGWDAAREEIFAAQKGRGVIPADAKLTPRPDFLPAWDSLPAERKQVYARMMEAYAAALAYNDAQMGRVIDHLKATGQFNNTLILFIQGDNGASGEGGQQGLLMEESMINGYPENFDWIRKNIDELGGPRAHNHYPIAWAWAMNTPFQYYKQVASHFGGVRNGLVVSWPGKIKQPAAVRQQFLYVTDVAPTILEAAGVKPPEVQNGVRQMSMDGISFADTFTNPSAAPRRKTQVFEMMQNAGIYHDGWTAGTRPAAAPWDITTKSLDVKFDERTWELYHVADDFSQSNNLATSQPAKLAEMKKLFYLEAERSKILPLHGIKNRAEGRPSLTTGRSVFAYPAGLTRVSEYVAPRIIGKSFNITADVVLPATGANGVLVTQGGRFGGYSFYLKDDSPVFHYNMGTDMQYAIRGKRISPGAHRLEASFQADRREPGSGGTLTILSDGKVIGQGRVEHTHRTWISNSETFDVGEDTLTPVTDDYTIAGSRFTGELKGIRIELK